MSNDIALETRHRNQIFDDDGFDEGLRFTGRVIPDHIEDGRTLHYNVRQFLCIFPPMGGRGIYQSICAVCCLPICPYVCGGRRSKAKGLVVDFCSVIFIYKLCFE